MNIITKLNQYFFDVEEGEKIGLDGSLFYIATFGCGVVAVMLKVITVLN